MADGWKAKATEDAAKTYGGKPERHGLSNERAFSKGSGERMTSSRRRSAREIQLGRRFTKRFRSARARSRSTKASIAALAGQARSVRPRTSLRTRPVASPTLPSFAEVEVDVETGTYYITDFLAVADVATIIHPKCSADKCWPINIGHRSCHQSEVGVRSAVWSHVSRRFLRGQPPLFSTFRPIVQMQGARTFRIRNAGGELAAVGEPRSAAVAAPF